MADLHGESLHGIPTLHARCIMRVLPWYVVLNGCVFRLEGAVIAVKHHDVIYRGST